MGKGMKLFVPMLVLMLVAVTSAADLDMQKEVHELDHGEAQRVNMVGEDDQGGRRAGGNANINNNNTTATANTIPSMRRWNGGKRRQWAVRRLRKGEVHRFNRATRMRRLCQGQAWGHCG